jgi:DNA mismatch repair protein MutS2
LRSVAEAEKKSVCDEQQKLESRRQEILDEARGQGVQMLAAAEEKLRTLFRQIPERSVQFRQRADLTSEVRALYESLPEPLPQGPDQIPTEVSVREKLYVPALGVEAEVTRVDGERIELLAGGKKLRQQRTALRQYYPRRYAEQQRSTPRIRDSIERNAFLPRLVLVGKRVEDAQGLLDRFLDEALLHGEEQLEIVHGAGQGVLRKAVREFLAERNEVAVFHAAGAGQGGDNVTLVELRH